MMENRILAE
jgi:hypothetical protein